MYTHLTDSRPSIDFCLHLQSSNLSHFLIFIIYPHKQIFIYSVSDQKACKLYPVSAQHEKQNCCQNLNQNSSKTIPFVPLGE